jgi:hypothetical protein
MKRPYCYILLPFLLVVATSVNAPPCVPTYDQFEFYYSDCMGDRTLVKMERNLITFPDNIQEYIDTEGYGCCHPFSNELKCEPKR